MNKFLILSLIPLLFLLSGTLISESHAIFTPTIPINTPKDAPTINDFFQKTQSELLDNYNAYSLVRDNGERIDSYYFFDNSKSPKILIYIEDETDESLENYHPFNSDYFLMGLQTENDETYFIFGERNGNSCIFPYEKLSAFWDGTYSGCDGGAVEVKETDNGFALYAKFFVDLQKPTIDNPYSVYFDYYDITKSDEDGFLVSYSEYHFPDLWTVGKAIPLTNTEPEIIKVNQGKISVNDFLFKPIDILANNLEKNSFSCADDTVNVSTKQSHYAIDDVMKVEVVVKSNFDERIKFTIFDMNDNLIDERFTSLSSTGTQSFLVDLNRVIGNLEFRNQIYKIEVEFGIDGPKDFTYFGIGDVVIPEKEEECYFYLIHDKISKSASFVINVNDPSNTGYDQIQIFVDRNGDSLNHLDENDVSYSINTANIGAIEYTSSGGWETNDKHKSEGRIIQSKDGYLAFIQIDNVSENFRFALDQIDHTGFDLKTVRIPENGFSTNPVFWSDTEMIESKPAILKADKYQPDELFTSQTLNVNLILVGDQWTSELKQLIKPKLNTQYSPFIWSELNRVGITYKYNFEFVSISDSDSSSLFEFIKSEAKPWKNTFYGESDFDEPWGFGPWIQANHTEWIKNDVYQIDYKTMDVEKMEDYIQKNIISPNGEFSNPGTVNLVFISGDMDDIDFLHTYDLYRKDPSTDKYHDSVGMMGFGGKYNFYFFDLYAVPWDDFQGFYDFDLTDEYGYDPKWNSDMISMHDIHSESRYAQLLSDYVNNSTSMLITPSYLYAPSYKSNYIVDILLVADGSTADIPSLTDKFFDENKIKHQLEDLAPFSKWQINLSVYDINDRELSKSVKDVIQSKKTIPIIEEYPEYGTIGVVDSEKLKKALVEWAVGETEPLKDFHDVSESSWTIPVVIIIADSEDQIFIDHYGGIGLAPAHPDDPQQPCCAIGVTTDYDVWYQQSSVTDLVLHEIGHTLSFMHPFMGYDNAGEFKTYDYFEKWNWGVMGYNSPAFGCGFWYDFLVDEEDGGWCGIADTFFTKFDKDNYNRGVTVSLIKTAKTNIYHSMIEMENSGKDINNLPDTTKTTLTKIESLIDESESKLKRNFLLTDDGALKTALEAAILSGDLDLHETIMPDNEMNKSKVPDWVKNNAKWWADGQVDDSTFTQGIGFLIKEKIIDIDSLPEQASEVAEQKVPDWIKNNAGWWADGMISEDDFIKGVKYLVEKGIITLD